MGIFSNSNFKVDHFDFDSIPFNMDDFFKFGALGIAAVFMGMLGLLYYFLLVPVFKYGSKMMFVQSVRQLSPDFDMLINGFRKNYLNIVLANLLVTALVGIGVRLSLYPRHNHCVPACIHALPGNGQGS